MRDFVRDSSYVPRAVPIIWNKEALVKECGEWMKACKGIRKWGPKPPMPPRIAGISCTSSKVGYTYVEDDHVAIFVAEKEASFFEAIWGGYTTYFYVVFPLSLITRITVLAPVFLQGNEASTYFQEEAHL